MMVATERRIPYSMRGLGEAVADAPGMPAVRQRIDLLFRYAGMLYTRPFMREVVKRRIVQIQDRLNALLGEFTQTSTSAQYYTADEAGGMIDPLERELQQIDTDSHRKLILIGSAIALGTAGAAVGLWKYRKKGRHADHR